MLGALRAARVWQTWLRVLALLSEGELAVGELAQALGQSQPREPAFEILTDAGLVVERCAGAWVFYRSSRAHDGAALCEAALGMLDPSDALIARDAERLHTIRAAREAAAEYFERNAADWGARARCITGSGISIAPF